MYKELYKILVLSEDDEMINHISSAFDSEFQPYKILEAKIGDGAFDIIDENSPDVILLDISDDNREFSFIDDLKSFEDTRGIPLIALVNEEKHIEIAFDRGAVDFLRKPFEKIELTVRIKSILSLFKLIKGIAGQAEELEIQSQNLEQQKERLEIEKKKADDLLRNILPYEIAEQLKNKGNVDAKKYRRVSILFTDFKDFTKISSELEPEEIIKELGIYFGKFDEIIEGRYIEKIKTIGDAYMCVGGLPLRNKSNPIDTVLAALEIQKFVKSYNKARRAKGLTVWEVRIGIHTGKVVAGVIGTKKFAYDIWGDAVNTASRMESSGEAGRVNVSEITFKYIEDYFDCTHRGKIHVKSKGEIDMYFVNGLKPEFCENNDGSTPNARFKEILSEY